MIRLIPLGFMLMYLTSVAVLFQWNGNYDIATYLLVLLPPTLYGMSVGSYFIIPLLLQGSLSDKQHCKYCGHRLLETQITCPECGKIRHSGKIEENNKFGSNCATFSFYIGLCSLAPLGMPVILGPTAIVIGLLALISHRITQLSMERRKYAIAGIWMGVLTLIGFGLMILIAFLISEGNGTKSGVPW